MDKDRKERIQLTNSPISSPTRRFRRMFAAIGTSSVVVSSGLLAYQMYQSSQQQEEIKNLQEILNEQQMRLQRRKLMVEIARRKDSSPDPAQYVPVPEDLLEKLNRFDEMKLNPIETKEDFKAIIPRHLKKNWRLLHQANSGEYEQHLKAVKELSKLRLSDAEYTQLAQSCNYRTTVGLASCANVDLRFFMPPPPLPPSHQGRTIVSLFKQILTKLPNNSDELHECINYYTTTAIDEYLRRGDAEALMDSDISDEFFRESHHLHTIPTPQIDEETLIENCLQAMLSHSTVEEQCTHILEALPLFNMILKAHPNNPRIKSLLGKILANLSLHKQHHLNLYR
jgi:hypothetical protein